MADNTDNIKPPKRMRTGEFEDPFTREANKRRQEAWPIRLVPPLRSTTEIQKTRRRAWYRRTRDKPKDEDPESRERLDDVSEAFFLHCVSMERTNRRDRIQPSKYSILPFLIGVFHLEAEVHSCF